MNMQEKSKAEYLLRMEQIIDYIEANLDQHLILKNI